MTGKMLNTNENYIFYINLNYYRILIFFKQNNIIRRFRS